MRRRCSRGRDSDSDSARGQHVPARRAGTAPAPRDEPGCAFLPGDAAIVAASRGVTLWELRPSSVHAPPERKKGGDDTVAKPQEGTRQLQERGASLDPSRSPPGTVRHKLEIT